MDNQSNVSLGCHNKILKFVSETMAGVLGRFSFATATENGSNNENTVKKHRSLVVGLEKSGV